jgi:phospholipid/cholesterol/gamma-HCH transport system substrate-binding protein
MKISNEVKIGATALITIVVFIWLYGFLKGRNVFKSTSVYYAVYTEINGLTKTNPVEINGYKAGTVQSIDFINDKSGRLLVKFSVKKEFILPENTVAEAAPASLIAGMKIKLIFGKGPGVYKSGDTIPGRLEESIIKKLEVELNPLKEKVSLFICNLDTVLAGINEIMTPEFTKNVRGSMANLNNTTKNIDSILGSKAAELKSMIADLSKFSKMLADNSGKLGSTIKNFESVSDTIAASDLYGTIKNLKTTLEKTTSIMANMNDGKGSAGKFLTNDSLYINMTNSLASLDLLLKDLKSNPKRYVHFSLFGKKNLPSK